MKNIIVVEIGSSDMEKLEELIPTSERYVITKKMNLVVRVGFSDHYIMFLPKLANSQDRGIEQAEDLK